MLLIVGVKLKVNELLFQFTSTAPEPADPFGASTTIWVLLQLTIVPATPLKLTVPWLVPKPLPFTVTCVNGGPEVGLIEVIVGPAQASAVSTDQQSNSLRCEWRESVQSPNPAHDAEQRRVRPTPVTWEKYWGRKA